MKIGSSIRNFKIGKLLETTEWRELGWVSHKSGTSQARALKLGQDDLNWAFKNSGPLALDKCRASFNNRACIQAFRKWGRLWLSQACLKIKKNFTHWPWPWSPSLGSFHLKYVSHHGSVQQWVVWRMQGGRLQLRFPLDLADGVLQRCQLVLDKPWKKWTPIEKSR